jgi:CHAD domain-containing protein
MATGSIIPGSPGEQRGLTYWMERVLEELDEVRSAPEADAVHDLRVALRRCRSLAAVMGEVDPDPGWPEMRKTGRKLFRQLGELRDTQVLEEWVEKLGSENDVVRWRLLAQLKKNETAEREAALRAAGKFGVKAWKSFERALGHRARVVAPNSLAAKSLALERFLAARELHLRALRTEKAEPWHALRIGVKRFRYTVEGLLPELYESWGEDLKRMQDLLGEVHDLDVLAGTILRVAGDEPEEARAVWMERIAGERERRLEEYRELSMGERRVWQEWKQGLPQGAEVEAAAMARLQATARALGANRGNAGQVGRIAMRLFEELRRVEAGAVFSKTPLNKVMRAAAQLHGIGAGLRAKSPEKAARKFLQRLPLPVGWTEPEWDLLGMAVRYHRGEEPRVKQKGYTRLTKEEKQAVCAMAGVLRLARALRKCGVEPSKELRVERSVEALIVRAPGLEDSEAAAARVAAGKHLVETVLERPLMVQRMAVEAKVVEMPRKKEAEQVAAVGSGSD